MVDRAMAITGIRPRRRWIYIRGEINGRDYKRQGVKRERGVNSIPTILHTNDYDRWKGGEGKKWVLTVFFTANIKGQT